MPLYGFITIKHQIIPRVVFTRFSLNTVFLRATFSFLLFWHGFWRLSVISKTKNFHFKRNRFWATQRHCEVCGRWRTALFPKWRSRNAFAPSAELCGRVPGKVLGMGSAFAALQRVLVLFRVLFEHATCGRRPGRCVGIAGNTLIVFIYLRFRIER